MSVNPKATINRNLILIVPKQASLDWLLASDSSLSQLMTLEELKQEQDAYLVSEDKFNTPEDARRWVERDWSDFFSRFLFAWFVDESLWPKSRTLAMFRDWFDIQHHSMLWDLSDDPITHEQWD